MKTLLPGIINEEVSNVACDLGQQLGDWYLQTTAAERTNSILVTLTPERWLSVDYSKMPR